MSLRKGTEEGEPCPHPGDAMLPSQRYQDAPGVEHIPVVQIDLSVPLKVPGKCPLVPSSSRVLGASPSPGDL